MTHRLTTALVASLVLGTSAFAGDNAKQILPPPLEDRWQFNLSLPGWIPWLQGDTGVNGNIGEIDLGPNSIVPRIDMIVDVRSEARKGRFGILSELLYMSLSDGIGTETGVKKIDLQIDQTMADVAFAWRIVEGPRGYLDLIGGLRYTNLFQQFVTQPNPERINETSTNLVDAVSDRLASSLSNSQLRHLIDSQVSSTIDPPELRHPSTLPIAPLGGRLGEQIRKQIQTIIEARKAELSAAVDEQRQAVGDAAKAAAQERVDGIKKDLSKKIAHTMESKLDTRIARTDDWWDPYIGLRGRYNLNAKVYVTGKADIGGFGIGSNLTWTAESALGYQVTERVFSEVSYRALSVDYEDNGLTYNMVTHGPQVTVGITF